MHLSQVTGVGNREVPWNTHSYSCDHGDRKLSAWLGRKMVMARTSPTAVAAVMRLFAAVTLAYYLAAHPTGRTVPGGYDEHVIYLDQAWSREDGHTFYWISQGTSTMPYNILKSHSTTGQLAHCLTETTRPVNPIFVAGRVSGTDHVSRFSSDDSREVSSQVNARKAGFSHLTSPVAVQSQLPCFQIGVLDLTAGNGLCWLMAADSKRNTRT